MWKWALGLSALGLAVNAIVGPARAQLGYDRPGYDYANFANRSGDPAVCASRCDRDSRCRAWSFSYPRTRHILASCRLKSRVPARIKDQCCMSGVRGAGVIEQRRATIIVISNCGLIRPARAARKPVRPTAAAGPGPISGLAVAAPRHTAT